jgi:hypothetical protein
MGLDGEEGEEDEEEEQAEDLAARVAHIRGNLTEPIPDDVDRTAFTDFALANRVKLEAEVAAAGAAAAGAAAAGAAAAGAATAGAAAPGVGAGAGSSTSSPAAAAVQSNDSYMMEVYRLTKAAQRAASTPAKKAAGKK